MDLDLDEVRRIAHGGQALLHQGPGERPRGTVLQDEQLDSHGEFLFA
jgi:hypothetical protein